VIKVYASCNRLLTPEIKLHESSIEAASKKYAIDCFELVRSLCTLSGLGSIRAAGLEPTICLINSQKYVCRYSAKYEHIAIFQGGLKADEITKMNVDQMVEYFADLTKYCFHQFGLAKKIPALVEATAGPHVKKFDDLFAASKAVVDEPKTISLDVIFEIGKDDPLGTDEELALRHEIEETLGEFLEQKKLGSVSGGSMGSGTMEVFCELDDLAKGKRAILKYLKDNDYPTPINFHVVGEDDDD
jgi:hypothetical protein